MVIDCVLYKPGQVLLGVVGMNSLGWCSGECLNENKGCNACLVAVEIIQYRQCMCSFLISLEEITKKLPGAFCVRMCAHVFCMIANCVTAFQMHILLSLISVCICTPNVLLQIVFENLIYLSNLQIQITQHFHTKKERKYKMYLLLSCDTICDTKVFLFK